MGDVKETYGPAIALMSPRTLASFYADLDAIDDSDFACGPQQLVLDCLVAIVGEDSAAALVACYMPAKK